MMSTRESQNHTQQVVLPTHPTLEHSALMSIRSCLNTSFILAHHSQLTWCHQFAFRWSTAVSANVPCGGKTSPYVHLGKLQENSGCSTYNCCFCLENDEVSSGKYEMISILEANSKLRLMTMTTTMRHGNGQPERIFTFKSFRFCVFECNTVVLVVSHLLAELFVLVHWEPTLAYLQLVPNACPGGMKM